MKNIESEKQKALKEFFNGSKSDGAENESDKQDLIEISNEQKEISSVEELGAADAQSVSLDASSDNDLTKNDKTSKVKTYRKNAYSCFFKRFFDIFLSGLALLLLWSVIAVVAVLIRIKLGKGVVFTQWRLGRKNKPFKLYKFRTMKNAFDKNGDLLPDDQRITKFGTALRKTSLDELPQLWNIFIGNMSIIGPRPRMIQECVFLDEDSLNTRSYVRPGLTGLAQVNGRNNITFDKVVEFDRTYVKNLTMMMDVKIFFKTIKKVFKKDDINKDGTVSNEFYGDMLLRTGAITQEEYDKKQAEAKDIIKKAS